MLTLRRLLLRLLILCMLVPPLGFSFPSSARAASPLVIGEVAWAGSSKSSADEWVEIWNLGSMPLSLDGYALLGAGGGTVGLPFPTSTVLEAYSAYVIANYAASSASSNLAAAPQWVTTAVSLPNDGLDIRLVDAEGVELDRAGAGASPLAGSSGTPHASMVRLFPLADGSTKEAWKTADTRDGLDVEAVEFGTPGFCDACNLAETTAIAAPVAIETPPVSPPYEGGAGGGEPAPDVTTPTTTLDAPPVIEPAPQEATSSVPLAEEEVASSTSPVVEEPAVVDVIAPPADPQYPEIQLTLSGSFTAGETLTFDASSSSDPNGDIVSFAWDLGDGTVEQSALVEQAYATSGDYLVELHVTDGTFTSVATTTVSILDPIPVAVPEVPAPEATSPTSSPADLASLANLASLAPPASFRLNEIHAAPLAGREWVELWLEDGPPEGLIGWHLEDAVGTLLTFTASSVQALAWNGDRAKVEIPRAALNNGGDTVKLFDAKGTLIESVTYPSVKKGQSYARYPERTGDWSLAPSPTPGEENEAPTPPAQLEPTIVVKQTPSPKAKAPSLSAIHLAPLTSPPTSRISHLASTTEKAATEKMTTEKKAAAKKSSPATSYHPTSSKLPAKSSKLLSTTLEELPMLASQMHVKLIGTVGTVPGLLPKNVFVLHAPDGRGLYVTGNGRTPSPPLGATVEVTGTLTVNDDGARLKMAAADQWKTVEETAVPAPRVVDLIAPSQEDGWSLVAVTGTVTAVHATRVDVDLDGVDAAVGIKSVIGYRANRINKGDVINILGVLDTRGEVPTILPRRPEDIAIVEHAKLEVVGETKTKGLPPWTPFGAAGMTVALSESYKRLQKLREKRRLEQMIASAALDLQQTA